MSFIIFSLCFLLSYLRNYYKHINIQQILEPCYIFKHEQELLPYVYLFWAELPPALKRKKKIYILET